MRILKFFATLFKRMFTSAQVINIVTNEEVTKVKEELKVAEVREIGWFTKKNDLISNFAFDPIPIYSGPQSTKPMGMQQANGTILAVNEEGEYTGKVITQDADIPLSGEEDCSKAKQYIEEIIKTESKTVSL